jgi:GcrA cell cycle regulator
MTWTDERISELARLWDTGQSASAIGRILGVSKNAVVGKAHRMRLASRPSPIRQERRAPSRRRIPILTKPLDKSAPAVAAPIIEPAPEPRPRAGKDQRGAKCLWPIGDPRQSEFHFCDASAIEGKPYCADHCARAYIVRPSRGEERAA